jgi:GNAT superfamily N-acetyltransferase
MQFDAQTRHYRGSFPDAWYSVICVGGERAGRLIVNRSDDEILIVDIALLPAFRGAGVGGGLIRRLLEEAEAGRLPVRCRVLQGNDTRPFSLRFAGLRLRSWRRRPVASCTPG